MMRAADAILLDYGQRGDFGKEATQRLACLWREFDEDSPAVVRIGPANEHALLNHRFEPAKGCCGRDSGGDAKTRNRDPQLRNFGLQQVKQHVLGRVREQFFRKETGAQAARPNDRADRFSGDLRNIRRGTPLNRPRRGGRPRREPGERGGDATDFIAQLSQPVGISVGCDVGVARVGSARGDRNGERCCPFGLIRIDNELNVVVEQCAQWIDQHFRRGHDCRISAVPNVRIDA